MDTQRTYRKRINFKLPEPLLMSIDNYCTANNMSRTYFFETLARNHLLKKGLLKLPEPIIKNTWGDNIDNMPLVPEYEKDK